MADPFTLADIEKYKPLFKTSPRPNVLGTPAGLKALEAEKSGLESFLGKTDYSAQNQEANDLAKLQFALSLMGRGFASMGAAPQPGENALGAVGRTLVAPLAGDISTIAGPLMKQRAATRLAEQQEDRQLKLSALNRAQSRQDQAFADDADTTDKARALAIKMAGTKDKISEAYEIRDSTGKWTSQPVRIVFDGIGQFKGFKDLGGGSLDKESVRVWRKAAAAVKPFVAGLSDVHMKLKNADGTFTDVPAPAAVRVTSPDGRTTRAINGTTTLTFGPNGNAKIIKPGSKGSLYQAADTKKAYATQELIDLLGLPNMKPGDELTRNTFLPKGDAPENLTPYSTFTIGAATYDLRRMGEEVDGNFVRTYDPVAKTVRQGGKTYNLSGLTTDQNPLQSVGTATDVKVYLPGGDGLFGGDPVNAQRVTEQKYDPDTRRSNPVPAYFRDGKRLTDFRPVDDRNEAFKTVQPLKVTALNIEKLRDSSPVLNKIRVGEEILVQEAVAKPNTGADPLYRYVYAGKPVVITSEGLTALRTGEAPELVSYTNITPTKQILPDGTEVPPGGSVLRPQEAFAALEQRVQDGFSSDSVIQARARKEADFKAVWEEVAGQNPHLGAAVKPSPNQLKALHARFPGGGRSLGTAINKAIFEMQRLSTVETVQANPASEAASEATYSYAASTEKKLEEAGARYKALQEKNFFTETWEDLSFIEKQAFARIPPRSLNVGKLVEQLSGSLKALEDRRAKFKNPSADDRVVFAAAARSLILLKSMKKGGLLNQSGRVEGLFSQLGAKTFADYPIFSSSRSRQLNQVITDLNANLKTISLSEGSDGRPSNFRLQLQKNVLPEFTKPEATNLRNLDTIISKLENSMRSHFSVSLASDTVVPQSFVRMAAEAGIKVEADPRQYPWINPRIALEEVLPVTKESVLESIGRLKYGIDMVNSVVVGTMLPVDLDGNQYQKVDPIHVQLVKDGERVGPKRLISKYFK